LSDPSSPLSPSTGSERYAINRAIFDLARHPEARKLLADKASFLAAYPLRPEERQALLGPEWKRLLELGVLPNLLYRYYALHGMPPETFSAAVAVAG
jgi:aromatic-ring opening dioxygenase LigAB LigA subunit